MVSYFRSQFLNPYRIFRNSKKIVSTGYQKSSLFLLDFKVSRYISKISAFTDKLEIHFNNNPDHSNTFYGIVLKNLMVSIRDTYASLNRSNGMEFTGLIRSCIEAIAVLYAPSHDQNVASDYMAGGKVDKYLDKFFKDHEQLHQLYVDLSLFYLHPVSTRIGYFLRPIFILRKHKLKTTTVFDDYHKLTTLVHFKYLMQILEQTSIAVFGIAKRHSLAEMEDLHRLQSEFEALVNLINKEMDKESLKKVKFSEKCFKYRL